MLDRPARWHRRQRRDVTKDEVLAMIIMGKQQTTMLDRGLRELQQP